MLNAIDNTIRALADSPLIGRTRDELAEGLRSLPVLRYPTYVVFYRPTTAGIDVIRVLHGARELLPNLRGR